MLPFGAQPELIWAAGILLFLQLGAVAWFDARTMRIPNAINASLACSALVLAGWLGWPALQHAIISAVVCFAVMAGVAWGYEMLRGRTGLGGGDVKLSGAAGAWIGIENAQLAMLVASLAALAWALASGMRGGPLTMSTRLAFGPFLALGVGVVWILKR